LNLKKKLPVYVIRNIEKGIFEIRKIYGGGTRRYGGAGRSSPVIIYTVF